MSSTKTGVVLDQFEQHFFGMATSAVAAVAPLGTIVGTYRRVATAINDKMEFCFVRIGKVALPTAVDMYSRTNTVRADE